MCLNPISILFILFQQTICCHHPAALLRALQPLHTGGGDPQLEASDPVASAGDQLSHAGAHRRSGEAKLKERETRAASPRSCDRLSSVPHSVLQGTEGHLASSLALVSLPFLSE